MARPRLSLEGRDDPSAFIEGFAVSGRYVVDHHVEEVLARLPGDVRDFLMTKSVLRRMSAPLCDALTGQPGAEARCSSWSTISLCSRRRPVSRDTLAKSTSVRLRPIMAGTSESWLRTWSNSFDDGICRRDIRDRGLCLLLCLEGREAAPQFPTPDRTLPPSPK